MSAGAAANADNADRFDLPPIDDHGSGAAWLCGLKYRSDGCTLDPKSFANYRLYFIHGEGAVGRIKLNRFANEVEIGAVPWRADRRAPEPMTDSDISCGREWLQGFGLQPSIDDTHRAMIEAAQAAAYDPLITYLAALDWDGKSRIHSWLTDYLGVDPSSYVESAASKWLISAVARAFSPGCKADNVLVIEGAQDLGKSSALRAIASDQCFTDYAAGFDNKLLVEATRGKWIIELAEMTSLSRGEVDKVKALVTMQTDRLRPAYGRVTINLPRRNVFAATVNPRADGTYFTDETGNRRFWPVRATQADIAGLMVARDQLWAEAVACFKSGQSWWLEGDERADALIEQAERLQCDPWQEVLADRLETWRRYSTVEVLKLIGVAEKDMDKLCRNRAGAALRILGWEYVPSRESGKVTKIWRKAEDVTHVDQ